MKEESSEADLCNVGAIGYYDSCSVIKTLKDMKVCSPHPMLVSVEEGHASNSCWSLSKF